MIKKILIFGLVAVVAVAVAFSAFNVSAGPAGGEADGGVSSAPAIASDANPISRAPVNVPSASATAQGSGRPAGSAVQDSNWQSDTTTPSGGQGNRYGQGGQGQGQGAPQGAGTGTGIPDPQAAQNESITLNGVVSNFAAPNFTLITEDGQIVAVQLGNQRFVTDQGIVLQEGDAVTLSGFFETSDSFAVSTLTLDAMGKPTPCVTRLPAAQCGQEVQRTIKPFRSDV
jgi:hypothetical protein